ncbi:THUMP-like domain-containing protein [Flavisericum labens]|uniref:THUMP-like domain-containing protein n=1 Tax=Flavisericum labens TaxID=3377112 RepID=UPI00387AD8C1
MNKSILNIEIQNFIDKNINSDITSILLKGAAFPSVKTKEVIEQIEAKKRCKKKLPIWFKTENIYYPNKLNIEQTSSEITAKYKSEIIDGKTIVDLTGGFGVDCFYFSKRFKRVEHCEINKGLSKIVAYNYKQLEVKNITAINTDGIEYLKTAQTKYAWIYVDPSRRHDTKGKVFFLKDCLPNVPEHIDMLFKHSKNIMIKTSPLLDISVGIGELKHVKAIHVVAVNNEVKELLWILENDFSGSISMQTVNLKKNSQEHFSFVYDDEKDANSAYSLPLSYLYEPNSAILKSGGFHTVSLQLKVFKLHSHSHLYTSKTLVDFPGRRFKIKGIIPYNKKEIKKLSITKANITTRNFPVTVEQIRKKLKIKDGGDLYLFFTTDMNEQKVIVVATKI